MANYTIIGGDSKEYGPVTGEDIRQWVAEGRLDANSRARSENSPEWRQLSAFPEFASLFQSSFRSQPPPLRPHTDADRENAVAAVNAPAICLICGGLVNILLALWGMVEAVVHPVDIAQIKQMITSNPLFGNNPDALKMLDTPMYQFFINHYTLIEVLNMAFSLLMAVVIMIGAMRMKLLRNYEFAVVVAIMAFVPCLTTCVGYILLLPFGVWALLVLRKPGVKDQFH